VRLLPESILIIQQVYKIDRSVGIYLNSGVVRLLTEKGHTTYKRI